MPKFTIITIEEAKKAIAEGERKAGADGKKCTM
jgi:hypothetical protein